MKKILLLLFVFSIGLVRAQENGGGTYTLQQAIEYALQHHNSLKAAQLDVAFSEAQAKEYFAIGLPKLEANLGYNYYPNVPVSVIPNFISPAIDGRLLQLNVIDPTQIPEGDPGYISAKFGTSQSLFGSLDMNALVFDGSYFVGLKALKGLKELNQIKVGATKQEIVYQVTRTYYMVLAAGIGLETLSKNIANLEKLLTETKAIQKAGFIEQLDVDRLELSLQNLKTEREIVTRQKEVATNLLKFQMGYPMNQAIELVQEAIEAYFTEPSEDDLAGEVVFNNRIEYDILKKSAYLNDLNIKRFKASALPSVFAFATYRQTLSRNRIFDNDEVGFNPTAIIGVAAKVPIFDGFDRRSKIQKATIDRDRITLQMQDFERAMALQVFNARSNYTSARQRLAERQQSQELAQRIFNTVQIKVKEGVSSSIELSAAERELYTAQANFLNAVYEVLNAKADLDKALGKMDD